MKESDKTLIKYFIFALAVLFCARFILFENVLSIVWRASIPIMMMLILVYLLRPVVQAFQRHLKLSRTWATALAFLTILLIISGFISIILPNIISSLQAIVAQLPDSNSQLADMVLNLPLMELFFDQVTIENFFAGFSEIVLSFSENIFTYSTGLLRTFRNAIVSVAFFILSLLMAFYALRDYENIGERLELNLRAIFGDPIMNPVVRVYKMTDRAMKKFLIGKSYTCIFLGLLVGALGLVYNLVASKDIPYLPLIAFIIGVTNIIPYVGPFIGSVPSVIFALINGIVPAIALFIIILVAQQIENTLVSPKVIGHSVGLKPFWILLSVTVGGRLFGILGMLLTVPITSVILVLLDEKVKKYKAKRQ